jgi:hypothetical protein
MTSVRKNKMIVRNGNTTKREEVIIEDIKGKLLGKYEVFNNDPFFYLSNIKMNELYKLPIIEGNILVCNNNRAINRRTIIGVTIESSIFDTGLDILAPQQINNIVDKQYIIDRSGKNEVVLRPGAQIIGGRGTGFYDDYGLIIEAKYTGGDPEKFEDWAYRVMAQSDFDIFTTQWILLDNIVSGVSDPISITEFKLTPDTSIDKLLDSGEKELCEYYLDNPNKFDDLSPKQFEQLMLAIYKNLGFITEPIGAWNQADGGVDIIAVSKSGSSSTEFRIAIQCKVSKNKITARPIRELAGVLDEFHAHKGIVVTTSKFTTSAKKEAQGHFWRISLEDRDKIYKHMADIFIKNQNIKRK